MVAQPLVPNPPALALGYHPATVSRPGAKRTSDDSPRVVPKAIGSPPSKSKRATKELAVIDVSDYNNLKAGCTTEDIRMFLIQIMKSIEKDGTELEGASPTRSTISSRRLRII